MAERVHEGKAGKRQRTEATVFYHGIKFILCFILSNEQSTSKTEPSKQPHKHELLLFTVFYASAEAHGLRACTDLLRVGTPVETGSLFVILVAQSLQNDHSGYRISMG